MMSEVPLYDRLEESERNPTTLSIWGSLSQAIEAFQSDTSLRLLAVVDHDGRPVGAIFEKDVRRLLLNPYGHALLRNPHYSSNLAEHVRECPIIELSRDVGQLIDHYRRCDGREGMILTLEGKLYATLTNRRLLLLSAEHEQTAARARLDRADRIATAGANFESQAGALSQRMVELAETVQHLAEATVRRSSIAGSEITAVAAATVQTRASLSNLADRGRGLADAFSNIERNVANNREAASRTAVRLQRGRERVRELLDAAQSIDNVRSIVAEIAATVNLLSLNATIEAARAGDAGRGFAVVASEVRKLSDQTQEATQTIGMRVNAIRSGIELVTADYAEIVEAIDLMAKGAAEIDTAVSREGGTTRMIAQSVGDASGASQSIEQAVTAIGNSVRSAAVSARELEVLAHELRSGASALDESVEKLLVQIGEK